MDGVLAGSLMSSISDDEPSVVILITYSRHVDFHVRCHIAINLRPAKFIISR